MVSLAPFFVALAFAAPPQKSPYTPVPVSSPFSPRDNVEGSWVNLNAAPVRPMLLDGSTIYAVNTHDSTVEKFAAAQTTPVAVWGVPWSPVSIAAYSAGAAPDELLVACRGTYVLARLDKATGALLKVLELPSEPGDILVDDLNSRAFISCTGDDSVVQVDLLTNAITRTYSFPNDGINFRCKSPLFLSADSAGKVYVAPLISGNNSTAERGVGGGFRGAGDKVLDLASGAIASPGLPDEDLFCIDPAAGTVGPAVKGSGAVLFAHGFHPTTGKHWQLNTEGTNKGNTTVAQIRGTFIQNRLSVSTLVSGSVVSPAAPKDLDGFGGAPDPTRAVGQPYALAFHPSNGKAFVTGLLADHVVVLDSAGDYSAHWALPTPNSIPRGLVVDPAGSVVLVYCWGTNQILSYRWSTQALLRTYQLNHDPTPANVKVGRAHFYDGAHSQFNNASCASCHIDGRSDLLAWTLSNQPFDEKGPMLTQTLAGIEKMRPFHWRGEQMHLNDFNPAFDALLGGTPLNLTTEFPDFEAFVFSIQNPANPFESAWRVVDPAIQAPNSLVPANGMNGQTKYNTLSSVGGLTCAECHTLPTGTGNDNIAVDVAHRAPRRTKLKVAPFHELWRRAMPRVQPGILLEPGGERALLGAGTSHAGLATDLMEFVDFGFGFGPQDKSDIAAFVHQIDNGLAPAVHRAFLMDQPSVGTVQPLINTYLIPQGTARNCDIAALTTVLATSAQVRWHWSRSAGTFLPDDPAYAPRTVANFATQATSNTERTLFLGLPVGMSERWAIDYDLDGAVNLSETFANRYIPQAAAGPAPTISGMTVQWTTAKIARLSFETNVPTTAAIRYWTAGQPIQVLPTTPFSRTHSPLLTELTPSTDAANTTVTPQTFAYDVEITLTDRNGVAVVTVLPSLVTSAPFVFDPGVAQLGFGDSVVFGSLTWIVDTTTSPGNAIVVATIRTDYKQGGPPPVAAANRAVVATVIVDGVKSTTFTPGLNSYKFNAVQVEDPTNTKALSAAVAGDFLAATATNASGITTMRFTQALAAGQKLTLNLEATVNVSANLAKYHAELAAPATTGTLSIPVPSVARALGDWSFPDTLSANRSITTP